MWSNACHTGGISRYRPNELAVRGVGLRRNRLRYKHVQIDLFSPKTQPRSLSDFPHYQITKTRTPDSCTSV